MNEKQTSELITNRILSIQKEKEKEKPVGIAINGIEGTGKTVMAEKLTEYLDSEYINAIQVSIDGFHFNKEVRYKLGCDSAKGYYEDSYDKIAFVDKVLKSSQSEFPNYTIATHNLETDEYLNLEPIELNNNTILIIDGAYLFKPSYRNHWDLKIYLKTSFEIAMQRGIELTKEKFENRYHKSSRIYLKKNHPEKMADIIIDNSNFSNLKIIKSTITNT